MRITSLENLPFGRVTGAFMEAFADYDTQWDAGQIEAMFRRRGFDPSCSFAAFDGDRIVAFTCNGVGDFCGRRTVYDTGTGTVKEYRGRGLAAAIFEHALPLLRERGMEQYLLEVLQHNAKAVSVYRKLGFEIRREFAFFSQTNSAVESRLPGSGPSFEIVPVRLEEHPEFIGFGDFQPSWQNGFDSIRRAGGDIVCLGARAGEQMAGYLAFAPDSGDVAQLAVDPRFRRRGAGSLLLQRALELNRGPAIKIINTELGCVSVEGFLAAKKIPIRGKQFEMVRRL